MKKYYEQRDYPKKLNDLRASLTILNFEPLDELAEELDFEEFEQVLYGIAYDEISGYSNIFVYTYLLRMLNGRYDNWRIHLSISRLMGMILNHLDGGESIGLYHALEAHKLKPLDADTLEIILYYNHIPEKVLTDELAIYYSKILLSVKPDTLVARTGIFEDYDKKNNQDNSKFRLL